MFFLCCDRSQDEVLYILERLTLEPEELCGIIVGDACSIPHIPWHDWNVTFPPIAKPKDLAKTPAVPTSVGAASKHAPLKVLHLSDNHYDPYYLEGSNAECGEPLCCRATDGAPAQPSAAAGMWGDYRKCDTPKRTIENLYEHIAKTHPVSVNSDCLQLRQRASINVQVPKTIDVKIERKLAS
jgi:sphingomyelin phosphodiesterase